MPEFNFLRVSQGMGFDVTLPSKANFDHQKEHREAIRKWFHSFLWSLIFGVPCMAIMMVFMTRHSHKIHDPDLIPGLSLENLLLFLTSTPVLVRNGIILNFSSNQSINQSISDHSVLDSFSSSRQKHLGKFTFFSCQILLQFFSSLSYRYSVGDYFSSKLSRL